MHNEKIQPAEDSKEKVSNKCANGIENDVININGTETSMENNCDYKLGEFKRTANQKGEPNTILRFNASNNVDAHAERNREENVVEYIFHTVFRLVIEAIAKVEGDQV